MTAGAGAPRPIDGSAGRVRLRGADAARAVATVGVIVIHASAWGPSRPFHTIEQTARFSVPAFLVLTGVLLAYAYSGRPLGAGFARRRFARTLLPWLAWAPVFLAFDALTGPLSIDPPGVAGFFAQGAGHLWYLLLVPQFYLLFAIWPRQHRWALAAVAMVVQTALCVVRLYPVPPGWQSQVMLEYAPQIFAFWIGYFAVGVAVGSSLRRPSALRRALNVWRAPLTLAAVAATAGSGAALLLVHYPGSPYATFLNGTGAFLNPVLPLFVLSAAAMVASLAPPALRRSRRLASAAASLGEQSLGIYILHPIPLFFLGTFLFKARLAQPGAMALLWFAALVACTLIAALIMVRLVRATRAAATLGTTFVPLRFAGARRPPREQAA